MTESDTSRFFYKLNSLANREDVGALTPLEEKWLALFNEVADKYEQLSREDSFGASYMGLIKAEKKGKLEHVGWLRKTCGRCNSGLVQRLKRGKIVEKVYGEARLARSSFDVDRIDAWLDMGSAIDDLEKAEPEHANLFRWWFKRKTGNVRIETIETDDGDAIAGECGKITKHDYKVKATELGVKRRQLTNILRTARETITRYLGPSYGPLASLAE